MREYRKATKEFLRTIIVGDFFVFKLHKVTDAAKQVYYIGERTNRGGTVIGDTEEDVKKQLEAQVPLIKQFLEKTK
jgi:hypothetical protein